MGRTRHLLTGLGALLFGMIALTFNQCGQVSFDSAKFDPDMKPYAMLSDDMVVYPEDLPQDVASKAGVNLANINARYWPNGDLPVFFEPSFTIAEKNVFWSACYEWAKGGRVSCRPYSSADTKFLYVTKSAPGCFSYFGQSLTGSYTQLNLNPFLPVGPSSPQGTCITKGIAMHELGHALGMMHEHQRPDRNSYVDINYANLNSGSTAYNVMSSAVNMGPYDFVSIMHYTPFNGSKNGGRVMTPKPAYAAYADLMGSPVTTTFKLSAQDKAFIGEIYGRALASAPRLSADRFESNSGESSNFYVLGGTGVSTVTVSPPSAGIIQPMFSGGSEIAPYAYLFSARVATVATLVARDAAGNISNSQTILIRGPTPPPSCLTVNSCAPGDKRQTACGACPSGQFQIGQGGVSQCNAQCGWTQIQPASCSCFAIPRRK